MDIIKMLQDAVVSGVKSLYGQDFEAEKVTLTPTRQEFQGDYTVVVFPFTRIAKKKPLEIGEELGAYLHEHLSQIASFNVIQGFLNLEFKDRLWIDFLEEVNAAENYGRFPANGKKILIEFCSPNTNKPLHVGHIRNILLGWSVSQLFEEVGYEVQKVMVVNDRGIHICKSMLMWQKAGDKPTPTSLGLKGDKLVGKFYVEYSNVEKEQAANLPKGEDAPILTEAREMLSKWENNDPETRDLWKTMNEWVYAGHNYTYDSLGVSYDKLYYESDTYLLGKDIIEKGLSKDVFYQQDDQSVWIDLEDAKLDKKLVLRSDGTSVYITQDLGTAQLRYQDFGVERMVYVVGDEQDYHFKVLFETLKRLEEPYAEGLYHLSYGMVELPKGMGRMKSREGTVVDADDLIQEVIGQARENAKERGRLEGFSEEEKELNYRKIALGALKFFILKVQPKKRMIFNPAESLEMTGQTGPYIQNAYVRIASILRNVGEVDMKAAKTYTALASQERDLIFQIHQFPIIIQEAAESYTPSDVANFVYNLAKSFHKFYNDLSVLNAESESAKAFRLMLCENVGKVIKKSLLLLGMETPERM